MRRFRFNIGTLVGFVLICGIAVAALKESSDWWEKGVFTAVVLILLSSVLLAIHRDSPRRAFWLGFALFGSVYLGLSLFPPIEGRLVTSPALAYLHSKLPGHSPDYYMFTVKTDGQIVSNPQRTVAFSPNGRRLATGNQGSVRIWDATTGKPLGSTGGSEENFVKIGHSFFALVLGWFGGIVSRRLSRVSGATRDPSHGAELERSER
jgi:hypothetical protein